MTLAPTLRFDAPLLTAAEEIALARGVEAGLYAAALLTAGESRAGLPEVARRGRAAWQRLWVSNLRLVAKLAGEAAARHEMATDDLFQDGCIGLAEAMGRFDHTLGIRFSTYAHEYVRRHVAASAATRGGAMEGPNHRHRLRQKLRHIERSLQEAARSSVPVREVAAVAGVSLQMAASSEASRASLDEVAPSLVAVDGGYSCVDGHGTQFLDLLSGDGWLLRHRYGIGVPACTQAELAQLLGVSPSSVARMESLALRRARTLLEEDHCRLPVAA